MKFTKMLALALAALTASGLMANETLSNEELEAMDSSGLMANEKQSKEELGAKALGLEEVIFRSGKRKRLDKKRHDKRRHESKDSCSKDHSSKDSCSKESRDHKHHKKSKDSCSRDHKRHSSKDSCSRDRKHSDSCDRRNNCNRIDVNCPDKCDVLRVGLVDYSETDFAPFTTIINNMASGFDVSIWCQLAHCLRREVKFISYTRNNFSAAQTDLLAGKIDVVGTSQQIHVPLTMAEAQFNWIISRLCDQFGPPKQVLAYQFRLECCQLVRDVQECLNQLICDLRYAAICARIRRGSPDFTCDPECTPALYQSFCDKTVDQDCICCFFPNRPCSKRPSCKTCEILCTVKVTRAPMQPMRPTKPTQPTIR